MKKLSELYDTKIDIMIKGIKINSKEIEPGDLFVCTMGVGVDRHDYVEDAISRGAVAIVASKKIDVSVPVIYVENTNQELPLLMAKFTDYPDEKIDLIAVTGTNGKTTVAEMIQELLGKETCGYMGTNGITCSRFSESIRNTTPDMDRFYPYLRRFVESGCKVLSMEASSEAFYRHRLDSISFDVTILTNITEDHLNVHKTLENYIECKCDLFRHTKPGGVSVLNHDDKNYERVRACCKEKVLTYGTHSESDLKILSYELKSDQTIIWYHYEGKDYEVVSPYVGEFNVFNLSASILACCAYGKEIETVFSRVGQMDKIEGRMELLDFHQPYQIVLDYAHTPDALDKILTFLNQIKKKRIITVTGSAGGRERAKRPAMGRVVLEKSDYVIFTMDDPRCESVDAIIDDLVSDSTLTHYERIIDRSHAIRKAFDMAEKDDIVLIAGKGRDNYMAINEEYLPYSDYEEIQKYFSK